jgi:hypothetical protein
MDLKFEVRRLADRAEELHNKAEEDLQRAIKDADPYTPFLLEQIVTTQQYAALWERTRQYVIEGVEFKLIIGADRLPDTDDPKAALRNLLEGVKEPRAYRQGAPWPMDEAVHALEKRESAMWRDQCVELLSKAEEQQTPDAST